MVKFFTMILISYDVLCCRVDFSTDYNIHSNASVTAVQSAGQSHCDVAGLEKSNTNEASSNQSPPNDSQVGYGLLMFCDVLLL